MQLPEIFFKNIYWLLYKVNWNGRMICFPMKNTGLLTSASKIHNIYFMPFDLLDRWNCLLFLFKRYFFPLLVDFQVLAWIHFSLLIASARLSICSLQPTEYSPGAIVQRQSSTEGELKTSRQRSWSVFFTTIMVTQTLTHSKTLSCLHQHWRKCRDLKKKKKDKEGINTSDTKGNNVCIFPFGMIRRNPCLRKIRRVRRNCKNKAFFPH